MTSTSVPPVTVSVLTYNSEKTVIETLDSILKQTYPTLELVISDDCSTDGTVRICRDWISRHMNRFARTEIITSNHNTGISANMNRAWDACQTVWNKDIAGDDILFPNCIEDNMAFITEHPEAVSVFSRPKRFTEEKGEIIWMEDWWHDYTFFDLDTESQAHYLIQKGTRIPTCTYFCNIAELRRIGFRNDERIPLLEDAPKWVALARRGVPFHFFDKTTVGYRYSPKSLSNGLTSPQYYKSNLLYCLYYYQGEIKEESDRDAVYNMIGDEALKLYMRAYNEVNRITGSWDYKVGQLIMRPFHWAKDLINNILKHS